MPTFFWIQIILISFISFGNGYEDKYLTQLVYKYIYNHELTCGDPFYESDWLPAMGECIIDCEPTQFICLVNTNGTEIQKCRELSRNCTMEVRKYLGWTTTWFKTNSTTTSTTTPEPDAFVTSPEPSDQILELAPPPSTTDSNSFPDTNKIFRDPSRTMTYKLKKLGPAPDDFFEDNEVSKPAFIVEPPGNYGDPDEVVEVVEITDQYYSPAKNMLNYVPINSNSVDTITTSTTTFRPIIKIQPTPLESLDKFLSAIESFGKIEAEQNMAAQIAYGTYKDQLPMMPAFRPPKDDSLPVTGTRVDIVPPLPPTDPPTTQKPKKKLKKMLKKPKIVPIPPVPIDTTRELLPLPSIELPTNDGDVSIHCCIWALNGLCDRSWRKIRELCPRSCGQITCEYIEGVKSCTRFIEVDVEECYQKVRFSRIHGVRNVEVDDKKALIEDLMLEQIASKHRTSSKKNKKSRKIKKKRTHRRTL